MTNQELDALVELELQQWGVAVLQRLSAEIAKKKLVLSGELLRSLQFEVLKKSSEGVTGLRLAFQESGRMKDMRFVSHKKLPPVSALEDFVREVGLSKFRYVPGFTGTGRVPTESVAIRQIAWGIAFNRRYNNTHKPKKWFSKPFYGMIDPLINSLLEVYTKAASQSITDNLQP